jgi:hypothetical protein
MKTVQLLMSAALVVALSAPFAAHAQSNPAAPSQPDMSASSSSAPPMTPSAPAASDAASPVAATTPDAAAPMGAPGNPVPMNSPTSPGQAAALAAGDPTVISNGPVPDTRANRALYGQPLSATGRSTKPAGN